jgi:hypothetical protein
LKPEKEESLRRFKRGDLAVTVNSRAPLLNNGHIVQIVEVMGAIWDFGIEFGYLVERIDGLPFLVARSPAGEPRFTGGVQVYAHHWQLRPITRKSPGVAARRTRRRIPETA